MTGRLLVAVAATALTGLVAVGAGIALELELSGFGRRDEAPRAWYVAAQVLLLAAAVVGTMALCRWAGVRQWWVGAVALAAAVVPVVMILGLSV